MTDKQSEAAPASDAAQPQSNQDDNQPANQATDDPAAGRAADGATSAESGSAEQRAEEYLRMAQRAQADLINYRRRVDQERDELRSTARVDAASAILPILDDFERAISAIPAEDLEQAWVKGILLIERNLRSIVERSGLERIDAKGQLFDPYAHEAIMADEQSDEEENTVTQVIRPGYRLGNRIVRPAQVVVARGKSA